MCTTYFKIKNLKLLAHSVFMCFLCLVQWKVIISQTVFFVLFIYLFIFWGGIFRFLFFNWQIPRSNTYLIARIIKIFLALYGTQNLTTEFTTVRHSSLSSIPTTFLIFSTFYLMLYFFRAVT